MICCCGYVVPHNNLWCKSHKKWRPAKRKMDVRARVHDNERKPLELPNNPPTIRVSLLAGPHPCHYNLSFCCQSIHMDFGFFVVCSSGCKGKSKGPTLPEKESPLEVTPVTTRSSACRFFASPILDSISESSSPPSQATASQKYMLEAFVAHQGPLLSNDCHKGFSARETT